MFTGTAVIAGVIGAAIAMPAVGGVAAITNTAINSFDSLPKSLADPVLPQRSTIRDSEGDRMAYFYEQNRVVVPGKEIAQVMKDAIVAIEDSRFYEHNGVDVQGTLRAFVTNQQSGSVQQGGSTITQQLVKMTLLNNAKNKDEEKAATEQTFSRKAREASIALALEKQKSKERILSDYLNIAYFGSGAYGVEAAAQTYFSKSAKNLSLVEAATLAGTVQQPGAFDPKRNPNDSQTRRNDVLHRMLELGYITDKQYQKAVKTKVKRTVKFKSFPNGCTYADDPYFCDFTLQYIRNESAFGKTKRARIKLLENGGLDITTTLDPGDQNASQNAIESYVPTGDYSNKIAALSMVEPGTGRIKAMAQNTRWGTKKEVGYSAFNFNVKKKYGGILGVQAGSTFKVFTLAAALDKGISPYVNINAPGVATFYGFRDCEGYGFPPVHRREREREHLWHLQHVLRHQGLGEHVLHRPRADGQPLPPGGDRRVHGRAPRRRQQAEPGPVVPARFQRGDIAGHGRGLRIVPQ